MRWLPDPLRRLLERPHYDRRELDAECEQRVTAFLRAHLGQACYPISTDDLTVLVEQHVHDLDLYADLSGYGPGVDAVSYFYAGRPPDVLVAARLSERADRQHRLRSTLAHELGHVWFHSFLWRIPQANGSSPGRRASAGSARPAKSEARPKDRARSANPAPIQQDHFGPAPPRDGPNFRNEGPSTGLPSAGCGGSCLLAAPQGDWLEWQAGYVSGAILMPATTVAHEVQLAFGGAPAYTRAPRGRALIRLIAERFEVSTEAATVRLEQLDLVKTHAERRAQRSRPLATRRRA